jgi:hypothetical protein
LAKELWRACFGKELDPVEMMNEVKRKRKTKSKKKSYDDDSDDEDYDDMKMPETPEEFRARVESHMEEWLANNAEAQKGKDLPSIHVVDDGRDLQGMELVDDPVWAKRVEEKGFPDPYWEYFVKGRKAWEKKYLPGIPHGGRYRVYLHTPEGPVERVPAWASYVLPGKLGFRVQ